MQRRTTISSYSAVNVRILHMRIDKDVALLRQITESRNTCAEKEEQTEGVTTSREEP